MYKNYHAMSTPDVEQALDELKDELTLAVDDEEREQEIETEIEEIEELLKEREILEQEDEVEDF